MSVSVSVSVTTTYVHRCKHVCDDHVCARHLFRAVWPTASPEPVSTNSGLISRPWALLFSLLLLASRVGSPLVATNHTHQMVPMLLGLDTRAG